MKTNFFRLLALPILLATGGQAALRSAEPATEVTTIAADPFWPADGNFPVLGKTSSWPGFRAKNLERRTLFAQRQKLDRNAIVLVGDSIIEGWHTVADDCAGLRVKFANRGVGGDTTPNLVYRLQEDVLALEPRALVILIGTNDLSEHTTPEQIANNYRELLARIRASYPKIPIAWCLVMPRRGDDNYPTLVRDLNARIVALAKSDPLITVCDTFTPLAQEDGASKPDDFLSDRLHPNAAGLAAWKEVLYPILDSWKLGIK